MPNDSLYFAKLAAFKIIFAILLLEYVIFWFYLLEIIL